MNTSLSPVRFPIGSTHNALKLNASKAADFESMAHRHALSIDDHPRIASSTGAPDATPRPKGECVGLTHPPLKTNSCMSRRSTTALGPLRLTKPLRGSTGFTPQKRYVSLRDITKKPRTLTRYWGRICKLRNEPIKLHRRSFGNLGKYRTRP